VLELFCFSAFGFASVGSMAFLGTFCGSDLVNFPCWSLCRLFLLKVWSDIIAFSRLLITVVTATVVQCSGTSQAVSGSAAKDTC